VIASGAPELAPVHRRGHRETFLEPDIEREHVASTRSLFAAP